MVNVLRRHGTGGTMVTVKGAFYAFEVRQFSKKADIGRVNFTNLFLFCSSFKPFWLYRAEAVICRKEYPIATPV